MEALVVLIAEIIFIPAITLAGTILEIAATVFAAVLELLFGFIEFRIYKNTQERQTPPVATKPSKVAHKTLRYLRNTTGVIAIVMVSGLILVNYVFLGDVMKWAVGKIEQRSGIAVSYKSFEGDMFKADFKFTGLHAQRSSDPYLNFDIAAQVVNIDMAALWNPFSAVKLNRVKVAGVSGKLLRLKKRETYHERKPFHIQMLELDDIHLKYQDTTKPQRPLTLDIAIHDWNSQPMQSRHALFDLFFRSNAHGFINGKEFAIETSGDTAGRTTNWHISDVPIDMMRSLVGGPFKLIDSGNMDVHVVDRWQLTGAPDIDFAWTFTFKHLSAQVPSSYSGIKRRLAEPIVGYLNTRPPKFDISFGMQMNQEEFTGKSSLAAAGLWKTVVSAMAKELSSRSGYSETEIKSKVKKGIDAIKHILDKRRKGED